MEVVYPVSRRQSRVRMRDTMNGWWCFMMWGGAASRPAASGRRDDFCSSCKAYFDLLHHRPPSTVLDGRVHAGAFGDADFTADGIGLRLDCVDTVLVTPGYPGFHRSCVGTQRHTGVPARLPVNERAWRNTWRAAVLDLGHACRVSHVLRQAGGPGQPRTPKGVEEMSEIQTLTPMAPALTPAESKR